MCLNLTLLTMDHLMQGWIGVVNIAVIFIKWPSPFEIETLFSLECDPISFPMQFVSWSHAVEIASGCTHQLHMFLKWMTLKMLGGFLGETYTVFLFYRWKCSNVTKKNTIIDKIKKNQWVLQSTFRTLGLFWTRVQVRQHKKNLKFRKL